MLEESYRRKYCTRCGKLHFFSGLFVYRKGCLCSNCFDIELSKHNNNPNELANSMGGRVDRVKVKTLNNNPNRTKVYKRFKVSPGLYDYKKKDVFL